MSGHRTGLALLAAGAVVLVATATLGPVLAAPESGGPASGSEGPTLVGVQGVGSYTSGGYVARIEAGRETWRESSADTYFDVTRLPNGSVLAAFMSKGHDDCGPYDTPCSRTGYRIIAVEPGSGTDVDRGPDPRVVEEWSQPVRSHTNSEVHDVEPLPGGGVVLVDMDRERVVVVDDGEVTWEWKASRRYDAPPDPTRRDWLHMNDIDRIGDGRFLVSVRNANQLLVLQRGEGVVEVINGDVGGDRTGDPDVLYHQHNPQWLGDGAVLVADSENHRIVELHRTENGSWEPAWVLREAGGQRFDWPRDADRLPGGTTLITDTRNARLLVVDENGTVRWRHHFDYRTLPYEADRLPAGEPVGGRLYGVDGTDVTANGGGVPLLTPAFRQLSAAVRLPRWFAEPHLAAVLVGVVALVAGGVLRRRGS